MRTHSHGGAVAALLVAFVSLPASFANSSACEDYSLFPRYLGGVDTPNNATDVAVAGTTAYVVDNSMALQVVNISDPAAPVLIGSVALPGYARAIAVSGNHAYVACDAGGLRILDVTNPASPVPVGLVSTSAPAFDVAVAGDVAYVAVLQAGFDVVDVSTPASPVIVATISSHGCWRIAVDASRLVTTYAWHVYSWDATDAVAPLFLGEFGSAPPYLWSWSYDSVALFGDAAYVIYNQRQDSDVYPISWYSSSLKTFDVGGSGGPIPTASLYTGEHAAEVIVDAGRAYAVSSSTGLWILGLSNPLQPTVEHRIGTSGPAGMAMASVGGDPVLCMGRGYSGLALYGVAHPEMPNWVAEEFPHTQTTGVVFSGTKAYTLGHYYYDDGSPGGISSWSLLRTYNAANPDNLTLVGTRQSANYVYWGTDLEITGTKLFSCEPGAFYRSTLINGGPQTPVLITSVTGVVDTEPAGAYLLAARSSAGLSVLDPSPATDPIVIQTLSSYRVDFIAVDGTRGCTLDWANSKLRTLDVTNPAAPVFKDRVDNMAAWPGSWVDLRGTLAVVGVGVGTFQIRLFDVTDLSHVLERASITLPVVTTAGYLDGNSLYVTTSQGVWAIDVSDPTAPFLIGGIATDAAGAVRVWSGRVMACEGGGLSALPHQCDLTVDGAPEPNAARSFALEHAPNPFRTQTTIRYVLPHADRIALNVYDVQGRLVRRLVDGAAPDGAGSVSWDGSDDRGAQVSNGVYFVRLRVGERSEVSKIARLE